MDINEKADCCNGCSYEGTEGCVKVMTPMTPEESQERAARLIDALLRLGTPKRIPGNRPSRSNVPRRDPNCVKSATRNVLWRPPLKNTDCLQAVPTVIESTEGL